MKKVIVITALFAVALLTSAKILKMNEATVNQEQGIYLFVESTPTSEYVFLGDVKQTYNWGGSGQFGDIKKDLLKRCKKQYPNANGIIFHFVENGTDRADAILLK